MTFESIIDLLEKTYPISIQEEWDKSGFQCGKLNQEIHKIMISLDADDASISEAIRQNCDLLITHHPFIFKPISFNFNSNNGKLLEKVVKNDLCIYSLHTPLDKVSMNQWLLEAMQLEKIRYYHDRYIAWGYLSESLNKQDFIQLVKQSFKLDNVKVCGNKNKIKKVGVVGGSGSEFYQEAVKIGLDAFLTGDTKYHLGEEVIQEDTLLVDIGHHAEVIMVSKFKEYLESIIDLEIIGFESKDYYEYF